MEDTASEKKMITLRTVDNVEFQIEEDVAKLSKTIGNMIEDEVINDDAVTIPNVEGKILDIIIRFCVKKLSLPPPPPPQPPVVNLNVYIKQNVIDEGFEKMGAELFEELVTEGYDFLFQVVQAADYLQIKCLLDVLSKYIAEHMKDKSNEEVRAIFCLENDFTPEEEEKIIKENEGGIIED